MNKYLILVIAIPIIVLVNYVVFSFAETKNYSECPNVSHTAGLCDMLNHIIKQNDWIICSQIHKNALGYQYSNDWRVDLTADTYEELVKICGEPPHG